MIHQIPRLEPQPVSFPSAPKPDSHDPSSSSSSSSSAFSSGRLSQGLRPLSDEKHRSNHHRMAKGMIWATAEDLARNKPVVLSLYRQILRSLNSPDLPLNLAARLAKKAEVRAIFLFGAEERSLHNIADLIDAANYSLSILKKGRLP